MQADRVAVQALLIPEVVVAAEQLQAVLENLALLSELGPD